MVLLCKATIHTFTVGDCVTNGCFLYLRPNFIRYLLISSSSPQSWKKRGPSKPTRSNFFFKWAFKFVQYSKCWSFTMKIRMSLESFIFTSCKWCNLWQQYVNIMVISCSTFQKEEKECICLKYVIYASLLRLQFCRNLRVSPPPNTNSKIFILLYGQIQLSSKEEHPWIIFNDALLTMTYWVSISGGISWWRVGYQLCQPI